MRLYLPFPCSTIVRLDTRSWNSQISYLLPGTKVLFRFGLNKLWICWKKAVIVSVSERWRYCLNRFVVRLKWMCKPLSLSVIWNARLKNIHNHALVGHKFLIKLYVLLVCTQFLFLTCQPFILRYVDILCCVWKWCPFKGKPDYNVTFFPHWF